MTNEQFLEAWELEKQRLAALGHKWSMADAMYFSMQFARSVKFIGGPASASAS